MACDDCLPEDLMLPNGLDPEDPQFGDFLKNDLIPMMTTVCLDWRLQVEVAVPLETGQTIIDSARSASVEQASEEAGKYIDDLATVQDFFHDEIQAIGRVLELDGFDVSISIGKGDSPQSRKRD